VAEPITQALLSVSDKSGLVPLAKALAARGIKLLSTGGTASALAAANVPVTDIGSYTGFPEMLDGRVKTLHPKVHGGILARRDSAEHRAALSAHGIPTIDLVVVNLYPFRATIAKPGCTLDQAIENIDIGGPSMVRAAAKNWTHVGVVVDPGDYEAIVAELDAQHGALSDAMRFRLMQKAFAHTAAYDSAIATWITARDASGNVRSFPDSFRFVEKRSRHCATAKIHIRAQRSIERRPFLPGRSQVIVSCKARSCRTTTSPTATPPGNACDLSPSPRASSSNTRTLWRARSRRIRSKPTVPRSRPIRRRLRRHHRIQPQHRCGDARGGCGAIRRSADRALIY
jgi:hypothetical protein